MNLLVQYSTFRNLNSFLFFVHFHEFKDIVKYVLKLNTMHVKMYNPLLFVYLKMSIDTETTCIIYPELSTPIT